MTLVGSSSKVSRYYVHFILNKRGLAGFGGIIGAKIFYFIFLIFLFDFGFRPGACKTIHMVSSRSLELRLFLNLEPLSLTFFCNPRARARVIWLHLTIVLIFSGLAVTLSSTKLTHWIPSIVIKQAGCRISDSAITL